MFGDSKEGKLLVQMRNKLRLAQYWTLQYTRTDASKWWVMAICGYEVSADW